MLCHEDLGISREIFKKIFSIITNQDFVVINELYIDKFAYIT